LPIVFTQYVAHLMHGFSSAPEFSTHTASRSVQPFFNFAGLTSVTDRQTDHATQSVTTDHIYVRRTAMRSTVRVARRYFIIAIVAKEEETYVRYGDCN